MGDRNRLFISYSHDDTKWLQAITEQLAVLQAEGLVSLCDDSKLRVGEGWFEQLHEMMLSARLGLLLISAPFLSSEFVRRQEIPRLFDRHEEGGMKIYPLLVEPCPWENVAWLARLQLRPQDAKRRAKALSTFQGAARKQKIADVANEIAAMVKQ
ncbi:toll/interleukin-1 receptor domain-containing protein [Piscinibacter sp.]|uniref:toll/interleukin-1 receptor domain-containing protein n=1 Tax=Piscinibacter sp. TaxID=1903157 RepID=UPI002C9D08B0|nr:toll/interleukin-1 receptor domain-containing protein [Albitalea sp.]HUG21188.1 toll/interleukin-1 receptor domain-containing protein [Albitalea sp.]